MRVVKLEAEDIARPEEVSRDDLNDAYEAGKASFITPQRRRIQQLVFDNQEQADDVAAKLEAGTAFESIVESLGRTLTDVDLGLFEKPALPDQKVADAAFELALDTPSSIIEGLFGPVIIRITEIQPEKTTPLAEVEDELRREIALAKATEELFDTHDSIEDERAAGDSLAQAARKAGLTPILVEAVDRNGLGRDGKLLTSLPGSGNLLQQAFETGVGVEADPLNIGDNGYVWYEVEAVMGEKQKPLDEVRDDVKQAWIADKTANLIDEVAEKIAKRVRGGEDFDAVLGELLPANSLGQPVSTTRSELIGRNATPGDLSRAVISAGFGVKRGSVLVEQSGEGSSRVILRVGKIDNPAGTPVDKEITERLDTAAANDVLSQVVDDLMTREDVRVNRQAIEAALSF